MDLFRNLVFIYVIAGLFIFGMTFDDILDDPGYETDHLPAYVALTVVFWPVVLGEHVDQQYEMKGEVQ